MTIVIWSKANKAKDKAMIPMPAGLNLRDHVRELRDRPKINGMPVYEFIGTDNFGSEWNERRVYEVNAGRDSEPILYTPLYREVRDANLPRLLNVQRIGPGGVVLEEIFEGGEVKFASITSSEISVRMHHYGIGLEYSKDLVVYNELWNVGLVERQAGIAYNALLNHIHLNPFLAFTYTAANQTAAVTSGATTQEDFLLTIEAAITAARADTTNPRRGPYALLVSTANLFMVEKALTGVPQVGVQLQSRTAIDAIRNVIAYDGWTGSRGSKTTTYSGVTSGKGYLIDLGNRDMDCVSYIKQDFNQSGTQEDVSRFLTQVVYDTYFTNFCDVDACTEEITWPS